MAKKKVPVKKKKTELVGTSNDYSKKQLAQAESEGKGSEFFSYQSRNKANDAANKANYEKMKKAGRAK